LENLFELSTLLSCFSIACLNFRSSTYFRMERVFGILPNSFKPRYSGCCLEYEFNRLKSWEAVVTFKRIVAMKRRISSHGSSINAS
jgi:hypothetical protein